MSLSEVVQRSMASGSWVRRMFDEGAALKKRYGDENVFDLSLGNPIIEPPAEFQAELVKVASENPPGIHRYMANAGYAETRAAVARQLALDTGVSFAPDDIVMTCGAAGALNVVLKTLLNPGDEVIIFAPYFVEYIHYIKNHQGSHKIVPAGENFLPDLAAFKSAINPKTKAVIINSPNNPSGVVYSQQLLQDIGEILRQKEAEYGTNIYLISDEAYRKIIYDGLEFPSPLHHHPRTIVVTSHSKDLALPGERIGYIAAHPDGNPHQELMDGLIFCNRILGFVNAPALMQRLVQHLQATTVSIEWYQRKRDFLYRNLSSMGYNLIKPQGAFYMFPRTPIEDDIAFVKELQALRVLTVPGRGFGMPGYCRISYCVDDRTIEGALTGLSAMAEKYRLEPNP